MKLVILEPSLRKEILRERRRYGADRFDEVWNGVYVMSPIADNQHQLLAYKLTAAIEQAIGDPTIATVYPAINVSDQQENWKQNYRCPDAAVFVPGNPAQDRGTHWFGGPDFALEVVSQYDRSRRKMGFYAGVGVRELLLVDRFPWALELYRLQDNVLALTGRSDLEKSEVLSSEVLPVSFRLLPGEPH